MKNALLAFWCCLLSSITFAQTQELEERIKKIDAFSTESVRIQKLTQDFKAELENYKNPNLIKKDQLVIQALVTNVAKLENDATEASHAIFSSHVKDKMKELKENIAERETYKKTQKRNKELERNPAYSNRLNRCIEFIKQSEYNAAKAVSFTLNSMEKEVLADYEETHTYLIREKNMQDSLEKRAAELKKQISDLLSSPEKAIDKTIACEAALKTKKLAFDEIKKELNLEQYDVKLETWSLGLFNCAAKAQYFRPKNFPHFLMLKNENNLTSVIKLDPQSPRQYEVAYACKKKGMFGGCLDNEKKELCRLDDTCLESLTQMETSYVRKDFFLSLKSQLPAEMLRKRQTLYRDKGQFNVLQGIADTGKLGYFSLAELYSMMDPIIELSKIIDAQSPEDYLKKVKIEIEKNKKKMHDQIQSKAGSKPSATKVEETKVSINYLFTSMMTELESLLNDEVLQKRAAEDCGQPTPEREVFCQSHGQWMERVKVFEAKDEVFNLTPDECPRGVFRFGLLSEKVGPKECTPLNILNDLEQSVDKVNELIKE